MFFRVTVHTRCFVKQTRLASGWPEAFLKKASVAEEEGAMAQLVDGRAFAFALEFEDIFYTAANHVDRHNDFSCLDDLRKTFVRNLFVTMLVQNACSFDRRVVLPTMDFPNLFLVMGKIRYDLPCLERQAVALKALKNAERFDLTSMKLFLKYREDIELAAEHGRIGLPFYIAMKALRKLWVADVRENERLNKMLKLLGQRAPNCSLDLVSSRVGMKYQLGAAVSGVASSRRWSHMRPVASEVFERVTDNWYEGARVMCEENRFGSDTAIPPWVPNSDMIHQWEHILDPRLKPAAAQAKSSHHVIAAAVNRKLFQFCTGNDSTKKFTQPRFTAVACVEGCLTAGRPCRLKDGCEIFMIAETVNRSVRILPGSWVQNRVVLGRPWKFWWAANYFFDKMQKLDGPVTVIAFPVNWRPVFLDSSTGGDAPACFMEGFFPGTKDGQTPLITITRWQEVSCLIACCCVACVCMLRFCFVFRSANFHLRLVLSTGMFNRETSETTNFGRDLKDLLSHTFLKWNSL